MIKKTAAYMLATNPDIVLYPPIVSDENTDYYVLTDLDSFKSDFWQIKTVENLIELEDSIKSNPGKYLGLYDEYIYIKKDEIITGKLSENKDSIASIPSIENLLPPNFPLITPETKDFSSNPFYNDGKYNGYPLLLSICLLVSNRRDTLCKCLESLRPFLEELDCEIIAVDSSNDGSTNIAIQYGAKIIPFTWIDDFAAARNAALHEAKGAWILSIDDDEWFDNPSEIIDFFKSDQWKQCDTAFYKVRNYTKDNGTTFGDCYVQRMAKNHPQLHYLYPVHEAFDFSFLKDKPYSKTFNSFVHHYGYAYSTTEDKERKIYRNISGIYAALQSYPFDLRQHQQLCNELTIIRNYSAATVYAFKSLSLCKLQEKYNPIEALHWKRIAIIFLYTIAQLSNDNKLIIKVQDLTDLNEYNSFQLATIHYYLAVNSFNNSSYKEVCYYAQKYYTFRKQYLNSADKSSQSLSIFTDLVEPADKQVLLIIYHAYASLQVRDEKTVEKLLAQINYDIIEPNVFPILFNIYSGLSEEVFMSHFPKLNQKMLKYLYHYAKDLYLNARQGDGINSLSKLDRKLVSAGCFVDNLYVRLIHLYANPSRPDSYQWFLKEKCQRHLHIQDIAICGVKNGDILLDILDYFNFEDIQLSLRSLDLLDAIELSNIIEVSTKYITNNGLSNLTKKELVLLSGILEKLLFNNQVNAINKDSQDFRKYFYIYINLIHLWSLCNYNENMFLEDNFSMLPSTIRGSYYIMKALNAKDSGERQTFIDNLKQAVIECPIFDNGVKLLISELKTLPTKEVSKQKTEFEILGEQLKETAKQLIDEGNLHEAQNILLQLSKLLPNDKEIQDLLLNFEASYLQN
ncbi:glycosyltransferase [Aminipila terrae]|uniref:Glycosyltransferase n=1 Tax=Aminipila terrae TaxID=2697030 RepID=A0A6P1MD48_9FIRM|nr:glycosyltransferase [Aminipila terrae]QHI71942.1 glycosyltransferase [Aminipila terrae]